MYEWWWRRYEDEGKVPPMLGIRMQRILRPDSNRRSTQTSRARRGATKALAVIEAAMKERRR